jgi:hypothetical protein
MSLSSYEDKKLRITGAGREECRPPMIPQGWGFVTTQWNYLQAMVFLSIFSFWYFSRPEFTHRIHIWILALPTDHYRRPHNSLSPTSKYCFVSPIPSPAADIHFSALAFLEHPQIRQIRLQNLQNGDLCALGSSKFILITKAHNI